MSSSLREIIPYNGSTFCCTRCLVIAELDITAICWQIFQNRLFAGTVLFLMRETRKFSGKRSPRLGFGVLIVIEFDPKRGDNTELFIVQYKVRFCVQLTKFVPWWPRTGYRWVSAAYICTRGTKIKFVHSEGMNLAFPWGLIHFAHVWETPQRRSSQYLGRDTAKDPSSWLYTYAPHILFRVLLLDLKTHPHPTLSISSLPGTIVQRPWHPFCCEPSPVDDLFWCFHGCIAEAVRTCTSNLLFLFLSEVGTKQELRVSLFTKIRSLCENPPTFRPVHSTSALASLSR